MNYLEALVAYRNVVPFRSTVLGCNLVSQLLLPAIDGKRRYVVEEITLLQIAAGTQVNMSVNIFSGSTVLWCGFQFVKNSDHNVALQTPLEVPPGGPVTAVFFAAVATIDMSLGGWIVDSFA